jgi:hypothetical protein
MYLIYYEWHGYFDLYYQPRFVFFGFDLIFVD